MNKQTTITPQDLRIGNWVRLEFQGLENDTKNNFEPPMHLCEVTRIGKIMSYVKFAGIDNDFLVSYEEIEPIPLTDEIIDKCGFYREKTYMQWLHKVYDVIVLIMDLDDRYKHSWITYNEFLEAPYIHCRYLHELQNCYFAVTGEELEVKL